MRGWEAEVFFRTRPTTELSRRIGMQRGCVGMSPETLLLTSVAKPLEPVAEPETARAVQSSRGFVQEDQIPVNE